MGDFRGYHDDVGENIEHDRSLDKVFYIEEHTDINHIQIIDAEHVACKSASKRPKQTNDCTVLALAIALECSYDTAYDYLKTLGRKCTQGFELHEHLNKSKTLFNNSIEKIPFPAQKGIPRMTAVSMSEEYPKGTYILRQAKHICTMRDGVLYDTWKSQDRCIYKAWEIIKSK